MLLFSKTVGENFVQKSLDNNSHCEFSSAYPSRKAWSNNTLWLIIGGTRR